MAKRRRRSQPRKGSAGGPVGSLPRDLAAAEALRAAGSRCGRCGGEAASLVAVEVGGAWQAEHLARLRCNRHVRAELAEGRS